VDTPAPLAESSLAVASMIVEVSPPEVPADDIAASAAGHEFEPPEVESEEAPALPEAVEHALAIIQLLDTHESAKDEQPADLTTPGSAVDEVAVPEQPVSAPAPLGDVAPERSADRILAAADAPDAGDEIEAPLALPGAIEDGGAPGDHEAPPAFAESPAADPAADREENLDGSADEAPPSQASNRDSSDASAGEAVPPPHLSDEPSIGPPDVPAIDVPAIEVPAIEVPPIEMPTIEVPAIEAPTTDVATSDLPAGDVSVADLPAVELAAELAATDLAEPVLAEAPVSAEQKSVPSEPEPEDNTTLVSREAAEAVPVSADQAHATPDYILGSGIASEGQGLERLDHTGEKSISEPIQTPAPVEPTTPSLEEAETTQPALPDLQAAPGPEEDPADLFEPLPMPSPFPAAPSVPVALQPADAVVTAGAAMSAFDTPITYEGAAVAGRAAAVELQDGARAPPAVAPTKQLPPAASSTAGLAAASSPQMRLPLENSTPQPRPAAPMPRGIARPAPSDPLAALSEEELIALFS
jgi:chemosensory pili system protein ChpA (sensor histidine kinase/response regulator)